MRVAKSGVGIVARNRFGDGDFGSPNTYQQAITPQQFNGVTRANNAGINGGVPPVVNNAAEVYTERAGDFTGGSKCFFSPNNTDKPSIENAAATGTTTLPVADHDPGCYPTSQRQYVLISGAWSSFVFVRHRNSTDPAVVWNP